MRTFQLQAEERGTRNWSWYIGQVNSSEKRYHVIYKFCRQKLNSRLKTARKSHHKKDQQAVEAFKKLPYLIEGFRNSLDKNKYGSINLYFQDESCFGLMTKQKRVLVSKGEKPIGKFQHSYKWLWLWGCFSPITGGSFLLGSFPCGQRPVRSIPWRLCRLKAKRTYIACDRQRRVSRMPKH